MRALLTLSLLLLLGAGKPDGSQLDKWLEQHAKAVNAEALQAMKSVRKVGIMTFGTNQVPFTSYQKGKLFRLEQTFGDKQMVSILNEEGAWKTNPWNDFQLEPVKGGELRKLRELAMSGGLLLDGEKFGYKLSLTKEDSLGHDHPVIKVDCSEGSYYKVHLDPETWLISKSIFHEKTDGRSTRVATTITKYKEQGGVQFPSMLEETFQGEAMASYSVIGIDTRLDLDLNLFKTPDGRE